MTQKRSSQQETQSQYTGGMTTEHFLKSITIYSNGRLREKALQRMWEHLTPSH